MLAGHPDAVAVGEITHLPKNLALNTNCQCGMPVRECSFWEEVLCHLPIDTSQDPYLLETGFIDATRVIDHEHATRIYKSRWKVINAIIGAGFLAKLKFPIPRFDRSIAHTTSLFDAIRLVSHSQVVVDSSKSYLKALGLYHNAPQTTRLVVLCRDGRGVMWSELKSGTNREAALSGWKTYYERTLRLLNHVDKNHIAYVRYEDLTKQPEKEMRRLAEFLGFSFHPDMLRLDSKTHHLANGNDMRFSSSAVKRTDVSWNEMPADDLRYFEKHAGAFNTWLTTEVGQNISDT